MTAAQRARTTRALLGPEARKRKAAQIILLIPLTRFILHAHHRKRDLDRRTATKHAAGHTSPRPITTPEDPAP